MHQASGAGALTDRSESLFTRPLVHLLAAEGIVSAAATLLITGIFFYTTHRFGWELRHNFLLATAQGLIYIVGALGAQAVERALGRRRALTLLYLVLAAISGVALLGKGPVLVTAMLLSYTLVIALTWPILEGMVSSDSDAQQLSRRLGIYNLVWALTGALAMAVNGALIEYWPAGVFVLPMAIHLAAAALILTAPGDPAAEAAVAVAHEAPEPELLAQRRVALWLSRISMPAAYVVIFSLSAMLPSLPAIKQLPASVATLIGSAWLVARFITFVILGAAVWWHTRPGLLFWASVVMFASFLGVVVPPAIQGIPATAALGSMIAAQLVLGAAIGLIYAASLYFGMVLSEGSTEHGGYHEALIGVGQVVGPGVGAITTFLRPGDLRLGISSVSLVIALTVALAAYAKWRGSRQG